MKSFVGEYFSPPPVVGFPRFIRRPILDITPPIIEQVVVIFYGWGLRVKVEAVAKIIKIVVQGKKEQT